MTPTAAEVIDPTRQLQDAPEFWRFTPCNGGKIPINPVTGCHANDWQLNPYTLIDIATLNGNAPAIGLMTGPASLTLCVDFDGPGSDQTFKHHLNRSVDELPDTLAWTSGRPGRHQRAYLVPEAWLDKLEYRKLKTEGNGVVELRWQGQQSVIAGPHPNKDGDGWGYYYWCPGYSPADGMELAEAPEWLLQAMARGRSQKTGFLSKVAKDKLCEFAGSILYDISRTREILTKFATAEQYDYDDWLMVGMVCHYLGAESGQEEECFDLWNDWSAGQSNYHEESDGRSGRELCEYKWSTFDSSKASAKKFGTLLVWAQRECNYKAGQTYQQFTSALPDKVKKAINLVVDPEKEREEKINTAITKLFELEKNGGDWAARMGHRSVLGGYRVKTEQQDKQLLEMLADEWGLQIGDTGPRRRTNRTLRDATNSDDCLPVLIPGFVYQGADTLIYSDAGVGKTLLAASLNYHAAMGGKPIGQMEHVDQAKTGRTLWIGTDGAELAFGMLKRYVQILNAPATEQWLDRLTFWGANKATGDTPWACNVHGLNALIQELQRAEDEGDPYVMVTIDSAKAVLELGGIDFGIGAVGTVLRLMQAVAARFNIGVVWIHHTGKGSSVGKTTDAGGSANFSQIPYGLMRLAKVDAKGHNHVVRCHNMKIRGSEQRKFFDYTLDRERGLFMEVEAEGAETSDLLYEIWISRDSGISANDLKKSQPDVPPWKVGEQLTELCKRKILYKAKKMWWPTHLCAAEVVKTNPDLKEEAEAWAAAFRTKSPYYKSSEKGGGGQLKLIRS